MCILNIQYGSLRNKEQENTMAVVAAPNIAINDKTETCPMNVAMASNTNTPYTYGCCKMLLQTDRY